MSGQRRRTDATPRMADASDPSSAVASLRWRARLVLGALFVVGAIIAAPSGIGLIWFVPYAIVGTVLAIRRPDTSIGWILVGLSWSFAAVSTTVDATPEQFAAGSLGPITAGLAVLTSAAGFALFLMLALLAIVFPSGRLPRGPWGTIACSSLAAGLATLVLSLCMPTISVSLAGFSTGVGVRNPGAVLPDLPIWGVVTPDTVIVPLVILLVGSVASLVIRYRRAIGVERMQLRWVTTALALVIAGLLGGLAVGALIPPAAESGVIWIGPIVAIPLVPVAIGIAVLRYRLYEIDRIISRTISWTLTTSVIVAVFMGAVVGLQGVLAPVTGGNTVAIAGSTLVAAGLFQPLRRRVQGAVDHRFNRAGYDAERIVAAFALGLGAETSLGEVQQKVVIVVDTSLGPRNAGLWIRERAGGRSI